MKPLFAVLKLNYPKMSEFPRDKLYAEIGWSDLTNKVAYENTCAIRLSVALAGAGIAIQGRMKIKAGRLKGSLVEPGQNKLSYILKRLWGAPEIYKRKDAAKNAIGTRNGVISFFQIRGPGDAQGHIDIIAPDSNFYTCAMSCYFDAVEIWFWPLP